MKAARIMSVVVISFVVVVFIPQVAPAQDVPIYTLRDDLTGGDCPSMGGVWDSQTKTCTLMTDMYGHITIVGSGITLDGNGFETEGEHTPYMDRGGIELLGVTGVTVKNFREIEGFYLGILLYNSHGNTIVHNTVTDNSDGIRIEFSNGNLISGNVVFENASAGIRNHQYGTDNEISGNIVFYNRTGIRAC